MKRFLKSPPRFNPEASPVPRPGLRVAGLAMLGNALCIATAETVIGPLDQTDNFAAMAEAPGRLETGGFLHLLGAILLGVAVAGLARAVWPTVMGKVSIVLLAIAVPCGGAFAMFHLVLVETVAEGLDPVAMEEFVVERATGPGAWGAPVAYYALVGFVATLLLLVALVRVGIASWIAPLLVLAAILMELLLGDGVTEIAAHWIDALAWAVAAVGVWRVGRRSDVPGAAEMEVPADHRPTLWS